MKKTLTFKKISVRSLNAGFRYLTLQQHRRNRLYVKHYNRLVNYITAIGIAINGLIIMQFFWMVIIAFLILIIVTSK